jgi:hypothetical protein
VLKAQHDQQSVGTDRVGSPLPRLTAENQAIAHERLVERSVELLMAAHLAKWKDRDLLRRRILDEINLGK